MSVINIMMCYSVRISSRCPGSPPHIVLVCYSGVRLNVDIYVYQSRLQNAQQGRDRQQCH